MIYPFVHAQRPQFPLRVPFVATGRQKRIEDDAQLPAQIETMHDDSERRGTASQGVPGAAGHRCVLFAPLPVAENLLIQVSVASCAVLPEKRQFEGAEPNLMWAADMTFIRTTGGWLYPAVVLDLSSRRRLCE